MDEILELGRLCLRPYRSGVAVAPAIAYLPTRAKRHGAAPKALDLARVSARVASSGKVEIAESPISWASWALAVDPGALCQAGGRGFEPRHSRHSPTARNGPWGPGLAAGGR
jgi:hypothetical protein